MATFWEVAARSVGHIFLLSFVYLYSLFISHFGFKSGIWLLIAPVPVHCFSINSSHCDYAIFAEGMCKNEKRKFLAN